MDYEILTKFINMKITELSNELKVANRYWKARVESKLDTYKEILELLKTIKEIK
jgi:uncharacterized protein YacL (UPF0231 family)